MPVPDTPTSPVTVDLTAVIIAVTEDTPVVLVLSGDDEHRPTLPSGPLQPRHGTLQAGLRNWVERRTGLSLGYVEQLYTFGDRPLPPGHPRREDGGRTLSITYVALVPEAGPVPDPTRDRTTARATARAAAWVPWYACFPWEDGRAGDPPARAAARAALETWAAAAPDAETRAARAERTSLTFGADPLAWDGHRALERYELLYEAALMPEAWWDAGRAPPGPLGAWSGRPLVLDHRRILATAISRLRGKITYRPVLFELLPETFTLLRLQRTAEAISGVPLHKQNFRRLVTQQKLVEETGALDPDTGGRPARLMRFRPEVARERPAPGVRVTATRRGAYP
ncbi:NUDIX hydrolase [Roseospira visakhapatnamensis]|uniref:NrtR DNA-binding winged helix domain-containing protein n=1 Tax=Roseospira visakhapatnamensis TaxID=390880 RepID=A0A7W6RAU1_9PROT|nr:hypothetical protein [Roseospira visakhapatnamensis]MBB4265135.1 hypothetical protein [Roseospira visakhapatnamensis]